MTFARGLLQAVEVTALDVERAKGSLEKFINRELSTEDIQYTKKLAEEAKEKFSELKKPASTKGKRECLLNCVRLID